MMMMQSTTAANNSSTAIRSDSNKHFRRRRTSKHNLTKDLSNEQLGIKQLLHLSQENECKKRRESEGFGRTSVPAVRAASKLTAKSLSGDGGFFQGKKQTVNCGDKTERGQKKENDPKPKRLEYSKSGNSKTKISTSSEVNPADEQAPSTPPGKAFPIPINPINATTNACNQSMNQVDHNVSAKQLSTSKRHHSSQQQQHHRQQQQQQSFPHPYSSVPFFPNLATSDPRRLYHPATTTAAAAGFFGLIPPAPSLIPSVAAASLETGWNNRRRGANVGTRTFTSFDYALGIAGIDPTSAASSSGPLFGSGGQDHFIVEFCDELFTCNNGSGDGALADENERPSSTIITVSKLKAPKRKSSAPSLRSSLANNNKETTGDTVAEKVDQQQHRPIHRSPTPPSSPPSAGQNTTTSTAAEEDSPKRTQHERFDVVLAIRGISLRDAVQGIVEKRKLNIEQLNLFLEFSNTPLPLETDTSFLGGHKLYAKAKKDDSRFSKHPLFVANTTGQDAVGGSSNQSSGTSTPSSTQRHNQKQGDDTVQSTGISTPADHFSTMSPACTIPPSGNNRKDSAPITSNQGLSKSDRKLSLTQLTKKKVPDRLSLTPDSSFALTISAAVSQFSAAGGGTSTSSNNETMLTEKPTMIPLDGGQFNGAEITSSPSSTPQHYQNGIMADSASTGSGSSVAGRKERSRSQGRLSHIFPNPFKPDDKLEMLERLAHFQEHGLMTAAGLLQDVNIILCQNALNLEERWQDLTKKHESLTRKQQEQQEGLWELVTTELNYIKKLGCIVELQACVGALQMEGFLQDVDVDSIFGNITDICRSNLRFWLQCLYPLLQYSRQTGEPLDPTKLEAGFQHIDRLFYPYIPYCLNHVEMLCYIRRKQKESELFREFVLWVQSRRVFGRLHLTDLLAKPMQRLTKYPLLLKAVLKSTNDEPGRVALMNVIEKAEEFASRVNIELRHKQHYDALCNIMQCIESYDAIETTNDELDKLVKEYSYVDLTASMLGCRPKLLRQLLLRGDLKLREGYSKMDVVCFLFTDMFLVCKPIGKKGERVRVKVARPPYHLDRVVVRQLRETSGFAFVFLNEFNLPAAASTFLTPNQEEACKWLEHFHIAKDEYQRMKLSDEVTVYKHVGRRSFDVSSLACYNSMNGSQRGPAMDGSGVRPNSSYLSAPSASGSTKNGCPHRRISMTAMDEKKRRKPSPASDAVNHRKSNSMDNSVVTSAIAAAYKLTPLHGSVDGLRESQYQRHHIPRCILETANGTAMMKSSSEDDPIMINTRTTDPDVGNDQDSVIRRLRANSVEVLKRLSPRLRTPSSGDRSPSPCGRPPSRGASPSVFFRGGPSNGIIEQVVPKTTTLAPFPSATSTGFSTPPTSPVPKLGDDIGRRLSGSHSPLFQQRSSSPFRKPKIPSPVFFRSDKHHPIQGQPMNLTTSTADGFESGGVSRCCSPSTSTIFQESASNSLEVHDEEPGASSSPRPMDTRPPPQPGAANARRLERRYHTADGIEQLKPRRVPQAGILKRFSWSTPAAAAAAAASNTGASSNAPKAGVNLRKASPTTISSESFGSSSGVSSSSSQLYVSQSENEFPPSDTTLMDIGPKQSMSAIGGRRLLKWSAVPRVARQQVAESADETEEANVDTTNADEHRNISKVVVEEGTSGSPETDRFGDGKGGSDSSSQPSKNLTVKDTLRHKMIPIIETQAPTPLATPVSTHPNGHTFSGAAVQPARPPGISKEEFLKVLLQGNLESSDV